MSKPKEDPADKKARLRERRMTELERGRAAQDNAAGLSSDLRAVYGTQRGGGPSQPFTPVRSSPFPNLNLTGLFS